MADLKSLIRLRKHNVDEKQKVLAELYRQSEALEARKNQLEDDLVKERQALENTDDAVVMAYFGRFSVAARRGIDQIKGQLGKLETRIRIAQDDMREAFANLKRIEIVQRNREEAEKKKIQTRESKELDEIGIEGFRRNGQQE